ncbi:MAG: hypothetical protein IT355_02540 [Gemmatimonadaceae bacterium]|nr:hypothetical protein [Gemmatimonadaceae bacterium]
MLRSFRTLSHARWSPGRLLLVTGATTLLFAGCGGTEGQGAPAADATGKPAAVAAPAATPTRVPRPDSVRALYVNAWAAGSRTRMAELIRIADATEINTFIVDIKESDTFLTYDSTKIALAREIGADQRPATKWLKALVDTLNAHRIYSVARIVVFKDRMLAEKKPEMAIRHVNGGLWRDRKGGAWVNPYDRRVWDYNIAIAKESLDMGFSELQWDYVRFPDVTSTMRTTMTYPGANGKTRPDNIRDFILYSKQALASYGVPVTADVFGLVTHAEGDVEIGQNWESVIAAADAVLPMVYPSHYSTGHYGFVKPGAVPYQLVRVSLTDAVQRTAFLRDSAKVAVGEIRPWLEAMSIRGNTYGAAAVRAQIQGTYDAGLKSWALWNPGSKFEEFEGAFRPAAGGLSPVERSGWKAPTWTPPPGLLSKVIQQRVARLTPPAAPAAAPVKPGL